VDGKNAISVGREEYVRHEIEEGVKAIAANTHAGAAEIAHQGADVLVQCAELAEAAVAEELRHEVLLVGRELIRAQPAMAPLVNLVNAVLWRGGTSDDVTILREQMVKAAQEFKQHVHLSEMAIAESALACISEGTTVLTNSRSKTVQSALLHARRAGRHFSVVCAEGRPGYEGRTMARELAEHGIEVTLVVDALACSWVPQAQVVLVGADHLGSAGLANKIGTSSLALVAQVCQVPFYALCSSEKFLPAGYVPPPQESRPAQQVWADAPDAVHIINYYFDSTPLGRISGVVTERGILTSEGIEGWLATLQLHPSLHQEQHPYEHERSFGQVS
jgi:translation initiation factor 2B subunit (eIF-2B alpha/beta/delta family)